MVKDIASGWFTNPFICNIALQLMENEDFSFQSQSRLQFKKFLLPFTHAGTPRFSVSDLSCPFKAESNLGGSTLLLKYWLSSPWWLSLETSHRLHVVHCTTYIGSCFVRFLCALNFRRHVNALPYRDDLPYQGTETSLQLEYNHFPWGMMLLVEGCSHSTLRSS